MNENLISIIIPVYNTEKYLRKCLESVCNQTFPNLEIIVVNDGSTDNSLETINEYALKDSRMIVIDQKNQGLSAARNSGIKVVKGNYIVFLDSDDWIEIDCCEKALVSAIKTEADIVLWSYQREYAKKSKPVLLFDDSSIHWNQSNIGNLYKRIIGLTGEELQEPQKIDVLITAWGKLYKRDVIGENSFTDTKVIGTEDALFNIQVFQNVNSVTYIPDILSHYRKDNIESLTHSYKKSRVFQWKELYKRIKEILDENKAEDDFYHALSNRICLGLIGLGLNLAEDKHMSLREKRKELQNILALSHYKKALNELEISYMPIKWKVFFLCARQQYITLLSILLYVMNYLRGK